MDKVKSDADNTTLDTVELYILIAMINGCTYGYQIQKWVNEELDDHINDAVLYRSLSRFNEMGYIKKKPGIDKVDSRRNHYRVTSKGKDTVMDELTERVGRLRDLCEKDYEYSQ